ncbi:MAG: exodeoxyribonuclease III, partial [Chloroflexi bacterium]|nr:exodeoxyribonuclease III [Chloroflexota bacterium]
MTLRALSWNVNGLRSVHRHGNFRDWFLAEAPDILCV